MPAEALASILTGSGDGERRRPGRQVANVELTMNFRIRKGTHVSHFHEKCPRWPLEDFYEQDKPLWWGNLCEECSKLADVDAAALKKGSGPFFAQLARSTPEKGS